MDDQQKTRLGILVTSVLILIVGILIYLKLPSDSDIASVSTTVETQSGKIVKAVNAVAGKVDVTNAQLETVKSTLGDISGYTSNIAENVGNITNNTYYCSLESRRVEKARKDSVANAEKLQKAKENAEKAQKELNELQKVDSAKTAKNKPAVASNPNGDLLNSIGTMIDGKLKPISDRLGNLEAGQGRIETRVGDLEKRMDKIETDVNKMTNLSDINARISLGEEGYKKMKRQQMKEKEDCNDLSGNK